MIGLATPSIAQGYAKSAGESLYPGLWRDLVGAWIPALGKTGATLFDVSGNKNHGALDQMDPPTDWVASGVSAKMEGYALDFDGTNDGVILPDTTLLDVASSTNATTVAYINISDDFGCIVSWRKSSVAPDDNTIWDLNIGRDGVTINDGHFLPVMRYDDGTGLTSFASTVRVDDGQFHMIASVIDQTGDEFRAYVDNQEFTTSLAADGPITTLSPFRTIGREQVWATVPFGSLDQRYIEGKILGVLRYNRVVTKQELNLLYRIPIALFYKSGTDRGAIVGSMAAAAVTDRTRTSSWWLKAT